MADVSGSGGHIAVTLSGGGHRAALFGLGALLYVIDAGKGPELACISSVSGGSMVNGAVAMTTDVTTASGSELRAAVRPLVRGCSTSGTLFAAPLTKLFLAVPVLAVGAAVALSFVVHGTWLALIWVVAVLFVAWWVQRRGWIAERAFDRALFHDRRLADIQQGVDHVICAADLQTQQAVYFSGRFLHSYTLGWGQPGDLRLARAVQSSAALPGAFHPRRLRTADFGFEHPERLPRMLLTDGGVYDNMATEWPLRLARRVGEGAVPTPPPHECDEVVVVNSSAGGGIVSRRSVDLPLVGELTGLLAVKDVLYGQSTAVRRRLLDLRYRRAGRTAEGLRGTTVQIDRSPLDLPRQFAGGTDERAERARAVLGHLAHVSEQEWDDDARRSATVKTSLSRIPADRAARLMRHAYALTMANTHVLLGYPLVTLPKLEEFQELTA